MRLSTLVLLSLLSAAARLLGGQSTSDSARTVPIAPLVRAPAREWGASVIVIDSAEIAASTARTFSELLQARRPGVRVFQSGGMASDGALFMLRGPTSVSAASDPMLVVDSVRVDSRQYDAPIGGANAPSRLDDLLPEDIERIEVLSGPAAALYGDGAAAGVIVVTTKSGGQGPMRVSGRATWDAARTRENFPANYRRLGVSPTTGQPVTDCDLAAVASGQCTPTELEMWNPLEQASPFHIGNSGRGHLEVAGLPLGTSAFAGITGDFRQGTLPHDDGSRLGLHAKVSRPLPWHLRFSASGSYLRDHAHLGSGILTSGLLGSAENDANRGYNLYGVVTDSLIPDQLLHHGTGGVQLHWQPLTWLSASVLTARDRVTEHGHVPLAAITTTTPPQSFVIGESRVEEKHALTTSGARAAASYRLPHDMPATTGLGFDRQVLRTLNSATNVANGSTSSSNGSIAQSLTVFRNRSTAFWVDEHVMLTERLAVSAALQRVTSSIFGGGAGKEWFPSANLSWAAPLQVLGVSELHLRAGYAETAGATEPLGTLILLIVPPFPGALPTRPKMERSKQTEFGVDAVLGGSATVSVTTFRSRSTHLWVTNPLSLFSSQKAEMINRGVEAFVAAPLLESSNVRWTGLFSIALFHNEVTRLNSPPQFAERGSIVQGKPYGGVWATPYTYADTNHDGIIAPNEIQLGQLTYVGAPLPRVESAFATDLTLPGQIVLSASIDYRGRYRVWNFTEYSRCGGGMCRGAQDPSSPLEEQAAAAAIHLTGGASVVTWMPNVSFMRVREVAARWPLPSFLTGALGTRVVVTLAGRNLSTWTNYRGLDPEISFAPPSALPRQDWFALPLPRRFVVRIDVAQRSR